MRNRLNHILGEELPESRRDSATKPRVARNELPWVSCLGTSQPQRGCGLMASVGGEGGHNPVGVEAWFARFPRVARRLATLGWRTQSLWDWLMASVGGEGGHNPVGVEAWFARFPRVARRLATLGWRTQSLWDWLRRHSGIVGNDKPQGEGQTP